MRARDAALAIAACAASVPRADACTCLPPPSDAEALQEADAVFTGRVLSREDPPVADGSGEVSYTIAVERVAKGPVLPHVVVTSTASGAICGISLSVGRRYLVSRTAGSRTWRPPCARGHARSARVTPSRSRGRTRHA